jgi:hypothetical protein
MAQREAAPPVDSDVEPRVRAATGYRDDLTGLPGRPLLREHLELALARARLADTSVDCFTLGSTISSSSTTASVVRPGTRHCAKPQAVSRT